MRLWRAIVLMNLALGFGVFLGYLAWGREYVRLEQQLEVARQQTTEGAVERTWTVRGVVRAVLPDSNVVVLTHEEIPGFMAPMTMGFRVHDPQLYRGLDIGETVRFTLTGVPPNVVITAISREGRS
jgi:Cu/Ag efflux protein CusF